jgi:hypothetical protein
MKGEQRIGNNSPVLVEEEGLNKWGRKKEKEK